MIVDLMRNDLLTVRKLGSVAVDSLFKNLKIFKLNVTLNLQFQEI